MSSIQHIDELAHAFPFAFSPSSTSCGRRLILESLEAEEGRRLRLAFISLDSGSTGDRSPSSQSCSSASASQAASIVPIVCRFALRGLRHLHAVLGVLTIQIRLFSHGLFAFSQAADRLGAVRFVIFTPLVDSGVTSAGSRTAETGSRPVAGRPRRFLGAP